MQKTITITGKKFSGKQISRLMDSAPTTADGYTYLIDLNGMPFAAQYRQEQDYPFAPVCSKDNATAIKLESRWELDEPTWVAI